MTTVPSRSAALTIDVPERSRGAPPRAALDATTARYWAARSPGRPPRSSEVSASSNEGPWVGDGVVHHVRPNASSLAHGAHSAVAEREIVAVEYAIT